MSNFQTTAFSCSAREYQGNTGSKLVVLEVGSEVIAVLTALWTMPYCGRGERKPLLIFILCKQMNSQKCRAKGFISANKTGSKNRNRQKENPRTSGCIPRMTETCGTYRCADPVLCLKPNLRLCSFNRIVHSSFFSRNMLTMRAELSPS